MKDAAIDCFVLLQVYLQWEVLNQHRDNLGRGTKPLGNWPRKALGITVSTMRSVYTALLSEVTET